VDLAGAEAVLRACVMTRNGIDKMPQAMPIRMEQR